MIDMVVCGFVYWIARSLAPKDETPSSSNDVFIPFEDGFYGEHQHNEQEGSHSRDYFPDDFGEL